MVRCKDHVEGVEVEFEEGEALATKCEAQWPSFSSLDWPHLVRLKNGRNNEVSTGSLGYPVLDKPTFFPSRKEWLRIRGMEKPVAQ